MVKVTIHKKKMFKRYKVLHLYTFMMLANVSLIEWTLEEFNRREGYELEQTDDFIGKEIEVLETSANIEQGHFITVCGELKRIDFIVHKSDSLICVVNEIQEEEDEITEISRKSAISKLEIALESAKHLKKKNEEIYRKYREMKPPKSWFERLFG